MARRLLPPIPVAQVPQRQTDITRVRQRTVRPGCCEGDEVYQEELLVGDAGIGYPQFLNYNIYSQLIPDGANERLSKLTKTQFLTQSWSTDNRPRFWEVSFYATDYVFQVGDQATNARDLLIDQNIQLNNLSCDIRTLGCPSVLQGRVGLGDSSGGRNQTFDVMGKRAFDIIADSAEAGFMLPENSYRIPDNDAQLKRLPAYDGTVAFSNIAVRITPIASASTSQVPDNVTCCVTVPGDGAVEDICNPPSARAVQFFFPTDGTEAGLAVDFRVITQVALAAESNNPSIASIPVPAGGGPSERFKIPNSSGVRIRNVGAEPAYVCVVFEMEP
jgi:hypothetical protein